MTQELMYGRRRFGSKLLAIALALVLCVGFFPGGLPSASAADDSDAITVTVSFGHGGESGFPLAPQRFTIQPGLSESYGYDDEFAGEKVSMLDAVVAAHEAVFGDGLTDELTVGGGGFVTRIMGVDSSSNLFFANGELPGDGEGLMYSVVQAELHEGDMVEFFILQDDYAMDTYAWFELDGEPVRRLVVDPDEEVELTLQGFFMAMYGLEYGGRLDPAASSGIVTLDVTDEGGYRSAYFDDYLGMTDEDGKITVSFDAEGTYCLSAFDEESDMALPLLPPWLEIVVGQDYADITDAKALVESTAFTATQAQVSSIAAAKAKAESVIGGLALNGVSAEVVDGAFTAAVAGTSGNPAGTNGSYTFTVTLNKGDSAEQTTASLTLAITATPYVYVPPGPTWPDGGSTAGGGVNPPDTGASGDIGSSAKITVKLNVNGGKGLSLVSQTYAPGDKLGTLPSPARKGYRFAGWYSAKSGGTKLTAESVVPAGGDFGIYAHWTAKKYTVKLNVNGGKALAAKQGSKTVAFDAKVGKLPTPKRPGYVFKGWYTAKEGGKRIGAATVYELMSGKTLYAHWAKEGTAAAGKKAASAVNRIA